MNYDEYLNFKRSRINEDVGDYVNIGKTLKVSYDVDFQYEIWDDGDVVLFVLGNNWQLSKIFKDLRSAKAEVEDAKRLIKRHPWNAVEELKLNGFDDA